MVHLNLRRTTLLDVVPGRGGESPKKWIANQPKNWCDTIKWGTLDLSGPYKSVFRSVLPNTTLVVDPFHLIQLANKRLYECRRQVQQEVLGNRGRIGDPLYRIRRLLNMAKERLAEGANEKFTRLFELGDPNNQVDIA